MNVPVVTSADYVFDAAAPGGALAPGESDRLNGWFQGLGIGYGDSVFVDGGYAPAARAQVSAIAGRYGMLVTAGAPVTAGVVQPGSVRVVVARRRATVPIPARVAFVRNTPAGADLGAVLVTTIAAGMRNTSRADGRGMLPPTGMAGMRVASGMEAAEARRRASKPPLEKGEARPRG